MDRYRSEVKTNKQKGITQPLLLFSTYLQRTPIMQSLVLAFVITLTILANTFSAFSQVLNEGCTASVLNRTSQVNPDGSFLIGNVPVSLGAFRVRVVCEDANGVSRAQSGFVNRVINGQTLITDISFSVDAPIPVTLEITSPVTTLTPDVNGAQLVATGALPDGTLIDLTLADAGTTYLSSNSSIVTVSPDGFVNAVSSGNALITATHEGVIATIIISVDLTVDSDGDGIPDDFEELNALNPGGANLSRLPAVQVNASSFSGTFLPERAIDRAIALKIEMIEEI